MTNYIPAPTQAELIEVRARIESERAARIAERNQIKAYANNAGYTDVEPYEVVRVVSASCVEVRRMQCWMDPTWRPVMIPGGFAAHTINNNEQRWYIASAPQATPFKIRLTKKGWSNKTHGKFNMNDVPRKFHDYNF